MHQNHAIIVARTAVGTARHPLQGDYGLGARLGAGLRAPSTPEERRQTFWQPATARSSSNRPPYLSLPAMPPGPVPPGPPWTHRVHQASTLGLGVSCGDAAARQASAPPTAAAKSGHVTAHRHLVRPRPHRRACPLLPPQVILQIVQHELARAYFNQPGPAGVRRRRSHSLCAARAAQHGRAFFPPAAPHCFATQRSQAVGSPTLPRLPCRSPCALRPSCSGCWRAAMRAPQTCTWVRCCGHGSHAKHAAGRSCRPCFALPSVSFVSFALCQSDC